MLYDQNEILYGGEPATLHEQDHYKEILSELIS